MSVIVRTWVAFAAIGVGLIHLALALGATPLLAVPLAVLGVAEFAWGVVTFARDAVPLPRVAFGVALAPVLVWIVMLLTGTVPPELGLIPLALSSVLALLTAALLGRHVQRADDVPAPTAPGIGRYLAGVLAGGLVVAALTTPALAATQAGLDARPSGVYGDLFQDPGHGH